MRPSPTMPSVLSASSTPSHRLRSHRPAIERGMGLRNVAGLGQQQRHRVLGRRDDVRLRGVDHHHAPRRRRLDVDVVETDPGAADDDEVGAGRQHLVGHLRGRADDQRLAAGDRRPAVPPDVSPMRTSTSWPASRSRARPASAISSVTRMRDMDPMLTGWVRTDQRRSIAPGRITVSPRAGVASRRDRALVRRPWTPPLRRTAGLAGADLGTRAAAPRRRLPPARPQRARHRELERRREPGRRGVRRRRPPRHVGGRQPRRAGGGRSSGRAASGRPSSPCS